ncbi:MAG: MATE family efflux transporter, partial [Lachnospiraceae bacterium]|nr:MATE family efflux transporter [Lachnospiraceae bacterium]
AKLCGMLYLLRALYVSSPALHSRKGEKMKLRKNQIVKALKIAAPIAAENAVMNTAQITSTRIVAPLGTAAVAANSLSVTAESLCYMPGYGIASAATSIIGQSIGAGRRETTKKIGWITTFLGMAIMTVSGILMYLAAPYMISFLSPDPQVIALGTKVLRIEAFAEPLFAASIVATGVMRGGGDTLVPAVLNLVCMWLIRIPLALYLAPRIGLEGVWLAMCIELCVRGVLFLIREAQGKYVRKQTA